MRQDMEVKRHSEVELFAGTVLELAAQYGVETPVNRELYDIIKGMEAAF